MKASRGSASPSRPRRSDKWARSLKRMLSHDRQRQWAESTSAWPSGPKRSPFMDPHDPPIGTPRRTPATGFSGQRPGCLGWRPRMKFPIRSRMHGVDERRGSLRLRPAGNAVLNTSLSWMYPWGAFFTVRSTGGGSLTRKRFVQPVLSVGNITSGGTGKTPLVIKLAEDLRNAGTQPRDTHSRLTNEPKQRRNRRSSFTMTTRSSETGDEAFLLSQRLPDIPVVISADRARAGRLILETSRCGLPDSR